MHTVKVGSQDNVFPFQQYSNEQIIKAGKLRVAGWSVQAIADEMGWCYSTATHWLKHKLHLPDPHRKRGPKRSCNCGSCRKCRDCARKAPTFQSKRGHIRRPVDAWLFGGIYAMRVWQQKHYKRENRRGRKRSGNIPLTADSE